MERWFRASLTLVVGVLCCAAFAAPASAKKRPGPGGSAAVAQYVEQIPTSSGSQATGVGNVQTKKLAPKLQRRLTQQAGKDAPLLAAVATSSSYGAPQRVLRTTTKVGGRANGGRASGGQVSRGQVSRGQVSRGHVSGLDASAKAAFSGKGAATADPTPRQALSAAVNVVSDGSDGRVIGLVVFLVLITAAALGAAAYRRRVPDRGSS